MNNEEFARCRNKCNPPAAVMALDVCKQESASSVDQLIMPVDAIISQARDPKPPLHLNK